MDSAVKYQRTLFEPEHELFRESYRAFLDRHVAPYPGEWEKAKLVERGVWSQAGAQGFSLVVVERGMEGFERGRHLDKIGLDAQDTAELSLTDVKVPAENLLGEEGRGFIYLMQNLPQERIAIAIMAATAMETVLEQTLQYTKERKAFGRPIGSFQNSRFLLAELATETTAVRIMVDEFIRLHLEGKL